MSRRSTLLGPTRRLIGMRRATREQARSKIHAYMHSVRVHVCMYACVHVCMYACMHVCMQLWLLLSLMFC